MTLFQKIEEALQSFSQKEIKKAYEELSFLYRKDRKNIHLTLNTPEQRWAYLAARLPATYEAVKKSLEEVPVENCRSVLDVGAGCGTASFVVADSMPNVTNFSIMEQNASLIEMGKKLTQDHVTLSKANWVCANMLSPEANFPPSDLVILSYSLNEIPIEKRVPLLEKIWQSTNQYLLIVEPGSKENFGGLMQVRELFHKLGAFLLGPCSHANLCPALKENDFCHFSARVQRTSLHRYLKNGERNFEDEKFSYLLFSKTMQASYKARVVRRPLQRTGLVTLKLCTENGFLDKTQTKKDKEKFRQFKDYEWGDKLTIVE